MSGNHKIIKQMLTGDSGAVNLTQFCNTNVKDQVRFISLWDEAPVSNTGLPLGGGGGGVGGLGSSGAGASAASADVK